jgi:hypothetical protein
MSLDDRRPLQLTRTRWRREFRSIRTGANNALALDNHLLSVLEVGTGGFDYHSLEELLRVLAERREVRYER